MARTIQDVMDYYQRLEDGHIGERYYPHTSTPIFKNKATLTFWKNELLDDIANLGYVEGDVMPAENEHDRHQVMDIVQDGNLDRVNRVLDLAVDECREMLYPFSRVPAEDGEENHNMLIDQPVYQIELMLPDGVSKTTLSYMEKLIHEYLTCYVMADWMSITNLANKNSAVNWAGRLPELKDKIKGALSARLHRVRRTQTPF